MKSLLVHTPQLCHNKDTGEFSSNINFCAMGLYSLAKEIEKGVTNSNYIIILDRAEAIKYAYKNSKEGDVILVAGKGAEDYIDEQGVKTKYSDFDEIEKLEK